MKRVLIIGLVVALGWGGALCLAAGDAPIIMAVKKNDLDKIKTILKADPEAAGARDHWDRTPLHWAARIGRVKAAALLMAAGADANAVNKDGETPLHEAVFQGKMAMAVLLLAKGARINALSRSNTTALHYAVGLGNNDLAQLLVVRGADVTIKNKAGLTPVDLANRAGKKALVKLMMAHTPAVKVAVPAGPAAPRGRVKTAPAPVATTPAPKTAPAPAAVPQVKTTNPADLLPPGPMIYIVARDLGRLWDAVAKSQWWSSLLGQLRAEPKTAAILTAFQAKWKKRTGLEFNRSSVMGLVGGWLVMAIYPGPGKGIAVAAIQLGSDIDLDKLLPRWIKNKPKAKLTYLQIRGQKVGLLTGVKKPTYLYLTPQRLLFLSPAKPMIEAVIARILGQAKDRFSAGDAYRDLVRGGLMKNQFGLVLTMVPGTIKALKLAPADRRLDMFKALKRMVIVSDAVTWRLAMDFKPEAKKFLDQFSRFFGPARGPADQGLFPESPLLYVGLNGFHLGRQVANLFVKNPKAKMALFIKAMGYPDLKTMVESMGYQSAAGLFGVAQGGLPLPLALLTARFKDGSAAARFVSGLAQALVARGVVPAGTIQSRKLKGGEVKVVLVPLIGSVGIIHVGPAVVVSNHLPYLSRILNRIKPAPAKPNWTAAQKALAGYQMAMFIDAQRLLGMIPEIYLRLGLSGRGPKLSDVAALIDLAGAVRYLTMGARWDGRTRFEMLLRVELKDHSVTKKLSAKILTGVAEALTGVLK